MADLDEKGLLPCAFCGEHLVEAHSFSTRTTKVFVHPEDDDNPCVANNLRVLSNDPDRIAAWNRRAYLEVTQAQAPDVVGALREIERLYWQEGQEADWRAAHMKAVAAKALASLSPAKGSEGGAK